MITLLRDTTISIGNENLTYLTYLTELNSAKYG